MTVAGALRLVLAAKVLAAKVRKVRCNANPDRLCTCCVHLAALCSARYVLPSS